MEASYDTILLPCRKPPFLGTVYPSISLPASARPPTPLSPTPKTPNSPLLRRASPNPLPHPLYAPHTLSYTSKIGATTNTTVNASSKNPTNIRHANLSTIRPRTGEYVLIVSSSAASKLLSFSTKVRRGFVGVFCG